MLTGAWQAKVKRWPAQLKEGGPSITNESDLAGQVGHPSTSAIFSFSCKQFATF